MKKIFAIVLCMILVLSGMAFAENTRPEGKVVLKDVQILANGTAIYDFTGIEAAVAFAEIEGYAGVHASLECNNTLAYEAVVQFTEITEPLIITATGLSKALSFMYEGGEEFPFLADMDSPGEAAMKDALREELDKVPGDDVDDTFDAFSQDQGTQEIDGVTYEVTRLCMTREQGAEFIDLLVEASEAAVANTRVQTEISIAELRDSFQPVLSFDGSVLESEYRKITDLTITGGLYNGMIEGDLNIYVDVEEAEATDDGYIEFAFTVEAEGSSYALVGAVEYTEDIGDASWLPAYTGGETIDLMNMTEAQAQQIETEMGAGALQALGVLMANPSVAQLVMSAMASAESY